MVAPPFRFHSVASDCALQILTIRADVIDVFSFEQARAVATNVLEDCQAEGGYGGVGELGKGIGWEVQVVGYTGPSRNRTVFIEGYEGGDHDITLEPGWIINTSSR